MPISSTQESSARSGAFRASMPPSYRRAHGWAAVREHAAIVERRGAALVQVEIWRVRRGTVIVIVSDDRAGGLAMMSAAIAASGFDILMAEAYRRTRDGEPAEAIAFFELRRSNDAEDRSISADELTLIGRQLEALFAGEMRADKLLQRNAPTLRPGPQAAPEVTFADDDGASILLVEARDRPGLLATITAALTEASASIVDSEIVTVDGRARDRFHLTEANGEPLTGLRRDAVAYCVAAAVERSGI